MFSTPAYWRNEMGEPNTELLGVEGTVDLGGVVAALAERDRERIVKCQGACGPRAWTSADRSDLVQLGGRSVAIGIPATDGVCLIRVS